MKTIPVTAYLQDIHHQTTLILSALEQYSPEEFTQNEFCQNGFIRSLEIIGEAAKHIPLEYRNKHPQIPWKGMAGLRDKLIHGYGFVDTQQVWHIVTTLIPPLHEQISTLLYE